MPLRFSALLCASPVWTLLCRLAWPRGLAGDQLERVERSEDCIPLYICMRGRGRRYAQQCCLLFHVPCRMYLLVPVQCTVGGTFLGCSMFHYRSVHPLSCLRRLASAVIQRNLIDSHVRTAALAAPAQRAGVRPGQHCAADRTPAAARSHVTAGSHSACRRGYTQNVDLHIYIGPPWAGERSDTDTADTRISVGVGSY